jgi:hypothetical protein
MSRLVLAGIAMTMLSYQNVYGMQLTDAEIAADIERQKQQIVYSTQDCPKTPRPGEEDIIIVCAGPSEDTKRQTLPVKRGINKDRIRGGEAVSNRKSASCAPQDKNCRPPLYGGRAIGSVPEPAIPLEEVLRGLPEPDMVVPEGSIPDRALPAPAQSPSPPVP